MTYRNHAGIIGTLHGPPPPPGGRIAPSCAVVTATVSGHLTLIDLGEGRRISLQSFGSRVWTLIADQPTLPLLLEQLRQDGGRPEQVAEDVARLLSYWRQRGMIEWR